MAAPTRGVWRGVYPSVHRAAAWLLGGGPGPGPGPGDNDDNGTGTGARPRPGCGAMEFPFDVTAVLGERFTVVDQHLQPSGRRGGNNRYRAGA